MACAWCTLKMPKNQYCFLCGVIDKENDKSLFNIPVGKFEEWKKLIGKPGLTKSSKLCESHFEKSEIHKGFQVGKDFVPASRNRLLTKNVVPTKNLEGIATCRRRRKSLKPCILNTGSPAGGPRLHTQPSTKIQKLQPWPPELVSAVTSLVNPKATTNVESPTATDGCHKDTVIPVILHLSPIGDVVANKQANGSVCDPIMNEKVGCNLEAEIRDLSQSSPLCNVSIEHENESVCDNTLTIEEETTTKAGCYEISKTLGKARSSEINTHFSCKGCKKYLSITYRKRNIVSRKISPYSCVSCSKNSARVEKLLEKLKEKNATIKRLRQQNARLRCSKS